jgi:hypothetical protein
MKWKARFFLLVILLLSACSSARGQAANPTLVPTDTPAHTATAVPATEVVVATETTSPQLTSTPFTEAAPAAAVSPTALPLPTQAIKVEPTPTPGGPPTPTPEPGKSLLDQYLPTRVKVAETEHFIFFAQDGYFPVDQPWWTAQAEQIYAYVSQRLNGAQVKHKVSLAFQPPNEEACPIRGLASAGKEPMIIIFAGQNSTRAYLLAVLAHEIGHAISFEGFPDGTPDNIALSEGIATWGSGKYWAAWKNVPSQDDLIRSYLDEGSYEAIHENTDLRGVYPWQRNTGQDCLARRDRLYSEWGSFTGYLIETYGWLKAHQLFRRPAPLKQPGLTIEFPPDYQGIYGKALNQLEWEWLKKLTASKGAVYEQSD